MSKKLVFLICFVLLVLFESNATAEDINVPSFAGCDQSCAVDWEFDVEPPNATNYMYFPDVADPCFVMDYWTGTITWNEGEQLVNLDHAEVNWYAAPPNGTGSFITLYCQITSAVSKENDLLPLLELWSEPRESGGEWLDGDGENPDYYSAVEIKPGIWQYTLHHTMDMPGEPFLISVLAIVTKEFAGSGVGDIHEIVLDAVIHDGTPPEGCPQEGRPFGPVMSVSNANPADEERHVEPGTNLSFQAPENAQCINPNVDPNLIGPFDYDVYFGTEPNVLTMTQLADGFSPVNCNDVMVFDPCAGDLDLATTYYWRVDINDANGAGDPCFYEGPYFSFTIWGLADNVAPGDGATGVDADSTSLIWAGDVWAETFDVYFSSDFSAVNDGSALVSDNQEPNTFALSPLLLDTEYYWRIDEVNGVTALKGDVWSFTAANNRMVEDFDSYSNLNALSDVWIDGWYNYSGSEMGLETLTVLDGNSMSLAYWNVYNYHSEVDADTTGLPIGSTNWSDRGGEALVLWFHGKATNAVTSTDRMYVGLDDSDSYAEVEYDRDLNDIEIEEWQEWNIDLDDFGGIDQSDIRRIYIGLGDKSGSIYGSNGIVYFDDIRIYTTRCVPAVSSGWGDVDGDCYIDIRDLQEMGWEWLASDYEVEPVEPSRDGLLVEYLFDSDYSDTSGNNYTGVPSATLTKVSGGALEITNAGGYVDIPPAAPNPFDGSSDFSISMKFKPTGSSILISSADVVGPNDPNNHSMAVFAIGEEESPEGEVSYDNFYIGGGASPWDVIFDGEWHHIAITYDADGGICPEDMEDPNICLAGEVTGLITLYLDGAPGLEEEDDGLQGNFDPNIPDIADDVVRIGSSLNKEFPYETGAIDYIGEIDEVRIYTEALSHENVVWLAGYTSVVYFPLDRWSNVVPKVPPGEPFDPDNRDIVNFRDYALLASYWLEGPLLWP